MVADKLLLNDGTSFLLLNDGTSVLLLNSETAAEGEGGMSGGRVRKKAGRQLISDELGNRPAVQSGGESTSRLVLSSVATSRSRLLMPLQNFSEAVLIPVQKGYSVSKLVLRQSLQSTSRLFFKGVTGESFGVTKPSIIIIEHTNKRIEKIKKLFYLSTLLHLSESLDGLLDSSRIQSFEFSERTNNEQLIAFTHSSSFVGNVRYDTDNQSMRILLNGNPYNFCNVPQRIFDAFEGADSKGRFFNRFLKDQFNC